MLLFANLTQASQAFPLLILMPVAAFFRSRLRLWSVSALQSRLPDQEYLQRDSCVEDLFELVFGAQGGFVGLGQKVPGLEDGVHIGG